MDRRAVLSASTTVALAGLAGCHAVTCRIDGNYDRLRLKAVEQPDEASAIVVRYDALGSDLQEVVDTAIDRGELRRCHDFNGEGTAIERLEAHIVSQWDAIGETEFTKQDNTYLRRGQRDYGIDITVLDANSVYSIPADAE
jgi:hypothetical protein